MNEPKLSLTGREPEREQPTAWPAVRVRSAGRDLPQPEETVGGGGGGEGEGPGVGPLQTGGV